MLSLTSLISSTFCFCHNAGHAHARTRVPKAYTLPISIPENILKFQRLDKPIFDFKINDSIETLVKRLLGWCDQVEPRDN